MMVVVEIEDVVERAGERVIGTVTEPTLALSTTFRPRPQTHPSIFKPLAFSASSRVT
jgi:hypothetical protein